jgi:UDP-glucose 4-epimerase
MKIDGAKILVTGSSGTIGTALCETLLNRGFDVVGVDIKPNKWNEKVQEVTINLDLRDNNLLDKLPKDVDLVIHLAANARVYNLVIDPPLARDNFLMTFNVLEYLRNANIKKLIFSSSREVYGNSDKMIHSEEEAHIKCCESPYTASKIGGEALIYAFKQCYDIDFIILRFSNVYGKYDESDRVVPLFIKLTKEGKDLIVYGKDKTLDFTYIDDTINGMMQCIEKFEKVKNDTFNLASGESVSILKVAQNIKNMLNGNNQIKIRENRTGEVLRCTVDISKVKEKLGYNPHIKINEGLMRSVVWYEENLSRGGAYGY